MSHTRTRRRFSAEQQAAVVRRQVGSSWVLYLKRWSECGRRDSDQAQHTGRDKTFRKTQTFRPTGPRTSVVFARRGRSRAG